MPEIQDSNLYKNIVRKPDGNDRPDFTELIAKTVFDDEKEKEYGKTNGVIHVWADPYDEGFRITQTKNVKFKKGVTVLVGCNGSGKSTLLRNIANECRNKNVAHLQFNNLHDGGGHALTSMAYHGDLTGMAMAWSSSEGEQIVINLGRFIRKAVKKIIETYTDAEEIWLLYDASDSGLSIDNVLDLKALFPMIIDRFTGKDIYIVIAANEYELAAGMDCLDVVSGKYRRFKDYDDYRDYILKTRKQKDARMESKKEDD